MRAACSSTAEALSLHVGCSRSVSELELISAVARKKQGKNGTTELHRALPLPDVVVIGAQKGGTTSLGGMAKHAPFCHSKEVEVHFFDRNEFAMRQNTVEDIVEYLHDNWPKCPRASLIFEKSPSYLTQSWTPQRMCESFGPTFKLAVSLREPASRAYSSFYQAPRSFIEKLTKRTPAGFHSLALIEMDIHRQCGGLTNGDIALDRAAVPSFRKCCSAVAIAHGYDENKSWPGCSCEMDARKSACGFFGDKRALPVRNSLYVHHLRNYFRFIDPRNILIFDMVTVVTQMSAVYHELGIFASSHQSSGRAHKIAEALQIEVQPKHSNPHTYKPILPETLSRLKDFYAPANKELFSLIGHGFNW